MIDAGEFDYVIAGGGTAGCVLAARVSEDPSVSVCLLEAGPSDVDDPAILRLEAWMYLLDSGYDWDYLIRTGCWVKRVAIEGGRATAVEYLTPDLLTQAAVSSLGVSIGPALRMTSRRDPRYFSDPEGHDESLRIADGSILPFLPAINPCITTMMVGEKCADMIKRDARASVAELTTPATG